MASFYYTTDDIIKSVKRRAFIPTSQSTFTNADFLAFMNEEMNMGVVPAVLRTHEDYFLVTDLIPLEDNTSKYSIPYRSIGNKLREVALIDTGGNLYEMTRIGVGDLPFYQGPTTYGRIYSYYIANNQICLAPENVKITTGYSLRVSYYIRPNSLVLLEQVAPIVSINRTTGIITVSNLPSTFNTLMTYDFVQVKSPHKCLSIEIAASSVNSSLKELTFDVNDIPSDLAVGDHICLATESAIPQVPSDLHVMLAHRVAARCLEALGDAEGLAAANQKLGELEQQTQTLIDNRVEDAPQKVVNRHAILRRGLYARRYRYRG